jgi:hypothetical protein
MSLCYICEYSQSSAVSIGLPVGQEPGLDQEPVSISALAALSAQFASTTKLIRVSVDAICSIAIGPSPIATSGNKRMAANQTEYFFVHPGHYLSVVENL